MVAYLMHGGKHTVDKAVEKIPLSDDTTNIQCTVAIGNPERHVRKASHRGSKQQ